jgi:hypothetical protein
MSATIPGLSPAAPPATLDAAIEATRWEQFDEALRPAVMGPRLATALDGDSRTCHVMDAKYEPGVRATVLYEYDGRLVRGDLVSAREGVERVASRSPLVVPPGVRLFPLPYDPGIAALPTVLDVSRLGPAIWQALPDSLRAVGGGRAGCRLTLLRYRPGRRATVLVTYPGSRRLVAKAYHDPAKGAAVVREATALAEASHSPAGPLRLPPTVAHLEALGVVVQRHVEGTSLEAMLRTDTGPRGHVRTALTEAALAVAALHDTAGVTARQRPVERELRRFAERAHRASFVDPELGASAGRLAERLVRTQWSLPPAVVGPVHGDCKPAQFLLTDEGVYMLDLDHLGVSDQAADVGTFLATLRQQRLVRSMSSRPVGRPDRTTDHATCFREAYLSVRPDPRLPVRIRWQEAVALQRKALRAFSRAPRSPLARALVAEGNHCLDLLEEAR